MLIFIILPSIQAYKQPTTVLMSRGSYELFCGFPIARPYIGRPYEYAFPALSTHSHQSTVEIYTLRDGLFVKTKAPQFKPLQYFRHYAHHGLVSLRVGTQ